MSRHRDSYDEDYSLELNNIFKMDNNGLYDNNNDNDDLFENIDSQYESDDIDDIDSLDENMPRKGRKKTPKQPVENKGKLLNKHSLNQDTIFRSTFIKKEEDEEEYYTSGGNYDIDPSSTIFTDSHDNEDYIRLKFLKEKINDHLVNHTEFDLTNNRKKPSKERFNEVFSELIVKYAADGYSETEIFVEYAPYFSEDLFAMFKMLDKKYSLPILENIMRNFNYKNIDGVEFI